MEAIVLQVFYFKAGGGIWETKGLKGGGHKTKTNKGGGGGGQK